MLTRSVSQRVGLLGCVDTRTTPYDNVGLQDHNQVLKADVTRAPELTNSVP
ncbi:hypothetical protein ACLB9X_05895 [Streptomyces sp. 5K101]|uniref:hypothetical protein n=1 Tax=Streptomyces sp. 5K101 TaxID=3390037 RepID=UPI003976E831